MIRPLTGLAFLLASVAVATADECRTFNGFAQTGALPSLSGQAPQCGKSRLLGGAISEDCFWHFALRSPEAQQHFQALTGDLTRCSEEAVTVEGSPVNHPDSFEQITGLVQGAEISLSLKDKGALSQTLIVLRRKLP